MQKVVQVYTEDKNTTSKILINLGLAISYIRLNELEEAEKLIHESVIVSNCIKSDEHIGYSMYCYGHLYKKAENWTAAIDSFGKALKYLSEDSNNYVSSLYHQIYSYIVSKQYPKVTPLLQAAKDKYSTDRTWSVYFEALDRLFTLRKKMTSKNEEACNYILNDAIPRFIKNNDFFIALEHYAILEEHYEVIRSHMKSLQMTKAIRDIYKRVFCH